MKKKIVLKALTDPKFREMLRENPENALTADELGAIKGGVEEILDMVELVSEQTTKVGTAIFCVIIHDDDDVCYA